MDNVTLDLDSSYLPAVIQMYTQNVATPQNFTVSVARYVILGLLFNTYHTFEHIHHYGASDPRNGRVGSVTTKTLQAGKLNSCSVNESCMAWRRVLFLDLTSEGV